MKKKYKKYIIEALYSDDDASFYPFILDEDGDEIYDGQDVDYESTANDAIQAGIQFIDEME